MTKAFLLVLLSCLFCKSLGKSVANDEGREQNKRQFLPIPSGCSSDYDCPASHHCDPTYNFCLPEQGHSNGKRQGGILPLPTCSSNYECGYNERCHPKYGICLPIVDIDRIR